MPSKYLSGSSECRAVCLPMAYFAPGPSKAGRYFFRMKYGKLFVISVVVFYLLFWAFTLLFPGDTVISRVTTLPVAKDLAIKKFADAPRFFQQWLVGNQAGINIKTARTSFYPNTLVNSEPQPGADTIFFAIDRLGSKAINGGLVLYRFSPDNTLAQLFYVFNTPWYKPWDKMATMMNDKRYGGGMDSALMLLKAQFNP